MTPSSLKSTDLFNLLCQCEEPVCIACVLLFTNLSNTYVLSKYHIVVKVWLCSLMFLIIRMLLYRIVSIGHISTEVFYSFRGFVAKDWGLMNGMNILMRISASWKWFVSDLFRLWRFWFPLQLLYLPSDKPHWLVEIPSQLLDGSLSSHEYRQEPARATIGHQHLGRGSVDVNPKTTQMTWDCRTSEIGWQNWMCVCVFRLVHPELSQNQRIKKQCPQPLVLFWFCLV